VTDEYDHRAEIALRNRRRRIEDKIRKLTMTVFGLTAYSAFSNLAVGIFYIANSPIDGGFGIFLGTLYAFAAFRVWRKDDTRWWPVAIPAVITILFTVLIWLAGTPAPIPILLNIALLIFTKLRRHACSQLAAVPNNSFKPTPLRGAA